MTETSTAVIDRKTLIPVSIAVSVIITFLAAWGWLNNQFLNIANKLDTQIKASNERFNQYDRRLERIEIQSSNVWSQVDQRLWVSEFRRLNPEMKIPDIEKR